MDLNAVAMFVDAVQAGSLSAGAERANVPLPTLSRRIRELERQLNVQLFMRSTRGARLTDAGQRFYEQAIGGIETLADSERAVMDDQARIKGRLRLSIPPAFEPWWRVLRAFQKRHRDIELSVYVTERRIDLLNDGIDVVLRVGSVVDESLVARKVAAYRHVLVASPAFIEAHGVPKSLANLQELPCAAWAQGADVRASWRLDDQGLGIRPMLSTNDYLHLRDIALSGEAVTELPPFLAMPYINEGRLVRLLPDAAFPEQTLNLLFPSHRYPSTVIRAYLDFCREHAPSYLG